VIDRLALNSPEPPQGPRRPTSCAHSSLTPSGDQQAPVKGIEVQRIDGAPEKKTAHYPKVAQRRMCSQA